MQPDQFAEEMRQVWQGQQIAVTPLTLSLLRRTALNFRRRHLAHDFIDLAWFVVFALFFFAAALFGEVLLCRTGCALLAIGSAYAAYQRCRGWSRSLPPQSAAANCSSFYRAEVTRRRDMEKAYFSWGVSPFLPGVALTTTGWIVSDPKQWPTAVAILGFWVGFQYVVWLDKHQRAARLQKELDLLDEVPE
jgi:hypothetical protein